MQINIISGAFCENSELFFEIELIAAKGANFPVEVIFDTGFTTGWLAIDSQDIEALEWPLVKSDQIMKTARGEESFNVYAGTVLFDGEEFTIPVIAGDEIPENILGLQWLQTRGLVRFSGWSPNFRAKHLGVNISELSKILIPKSFAPTFPFFRGDRPQ